MVLSPPYCWTLLRPVGFAFDSTTSSVLYCEFSLECIQKNMTSSKVRWERSLQPDRTLQLGWTHRLVVKWRGEDVILVCNTQIWVYCSLPKLSVYFDLQNFFFFSFHSSRNWFSVTQSWGENKQCSMHGLRHSWSFKTSVCRTSTAVRPIWMTGALLWKKKKISLKNAGCPYLLLKHLCSLH